MLSDGIIGSDLDLTAEEAGQDSAEEISLAGQLATLLEVSGYPKPGNIHRLYDFKDTRFEHFLASAVALGSTLKVMALRGMEARLKMRRVDEIGLGGGINSCVTATKRWHRGRNTLLGTMSLLVPLAAGAGMTVADGELSSLRALRQRTTVAMKSTTVEDAVEFYDAVIAAGAGGLGRLEIGAPDVTSPSAKEELRSKGLRLIDVMKVSAKWDGVAREWVGGMKVTFQAGYPTVSTVFEETGDINLATVHCYLTILSQQPDTLIARKLGWETAEKVSKRAEKILAAGGLLTAKGRRLLEDFDLSLRTHDNRYNPGTTADLTAASLMVAILKGLRP